tara:strand:- start:1107 stop:1484 length:378 start_codon:yes stop_codon:yes gene_type:complete
MTSWTPETLKAKLEDPDTKCLVKFTAKWCGPCQNIHKALVEVCSESELTLIVIDIDEYPGFGVERIPLMKIAVHGEIREVCGGGVEKVKEVLKCLTSPRGVTDGHGRTQDEGITPIVLASATIQT